MASSGNADFLAALVRGLIFGMNEGEDDNKDLQQTNRRQAAEEQCLRLVKSLIEELLTFEEKRVLEEGSKQKTACDCLL
ncbi:MAG: hypothetical protein ACREBR_04300 [bacterium]